jgi:hypothetical protein
MALGGLLWCGLAGTPREAKAKLGVGANSSCSAMTVCAGRPVIAFCNWGAGPVGDRSALVIATAAAQPPVGEDAWQFHLVRPGLCVPLSDNDWGGQIAIFPAGAGVGLVTFQAVESDYSRSQMFAAWSGGIPQRSEDWVVSPTGVNCWANGNRVAGAGTAEYIAAALVPDCPGSGPQKIRGVYLAVALLPLSGSYADWETVCVQLDNFPKSAHGSRRAVRARPCSVSLVASSVGLFMACPTLLRRYNALGFAAVEPGLVVGQCKAPLTDPSRWEFVVVDTDPTFTYEGSLVSIELAPLAVDSGRLYVAYMQSQGTWVAECPIAEAMDPSAWRKSRPVISGGLELALGVINGSPVVASWDVINLAGEGEYKYVTRARGAAWPAWDSCPLPELGDYLSIGEIAGRPVLGSYATGGSRLSYAWSEKLVPRARSDWHMTTIISGQPSDQGLDEPTGAAEAFPPIPVPGPMAKLAAGAIGVPPLFRLTWLSASLAGLALAAVVWFVVRRRVRRAHV